MREIYEAGYGQWSVTVSEDGDPLIIMYSLSHEELEAIGPELRALAHLETSYQRGRKDNE